MKSHPHDFAADAPLDEAALARLATEAAPVMTNKHLVAALGLQRAGVPGAPSFGIGGLGIGDGSDRPVLDSDAALATALAVARMHSPAPAALLPRLMRGLAGLAVVGLYLWIAAPPVPAGY
jgi:hypothetical protein